VPLKARSLALAVLLLVACFATYHRALRAPLDSDARFLATNNAFTLASDGPARVWTADFFQGAITHGVPYLSGYYRPVTNLLFWAEYRVAGIDPWRYHATQLLLHVLNAFLVFLLVRRLSRRWWAGALAAALFALHPVNAFAATQPAARADVLFATFYLAALVVFDGALTAPAGARIAWRLALTVLLYLGAVLSKETGITLPAALCLLVAYRRTEQGIPWWRLVWTVPVWAAAAAYLVWRYLVLQLPSHALGYAQTYGPLVLAFGVLKGVFIQVARLVLPLQPSFPELHPSLVDWAAAPLADPLSYAALALAVALGVGALLWRRSRVVAFWCALFVVTYAPLAKVDRIAGTLGRNVFLTQERWIYLPGVAVLALAAIAAVQLLKRWPARPRLLAGAGIGAVLLLLGATASAHAGRNADPFAELRRLYLFPEERLSRLERVNKLLLYAEWVALPMRDTAEAEARARRAVALVPDSPLPASALAGILAMRGKWDEVETLLSPWLDPPRERLVALEATNVRVADDLNRVNPRVVFLLARAAAHRGDAARAAALLCEAVRRDVGAAEVEGAARELEALTAARTGRPAPAFDAAACRRERGP